MMIKRAIPVARRISSLQRRPWPVCMQTRMASSDHPPCDYKYPTMDDAPVPCGDWLEDFNNKQRKYNIHLLFGAGFFTITAAVAYFSGLFWCNMFPPEKPGPRPEPKC